MYYISGLILGICGLLKHLVEQTVFTTLASTLPAVNSPSYRLPGKLLLSSVVHYKAERSLQIQLRRHFVSEVYSHIKVIT